MGEALGDDVSPALHLKLVITDLARRLERFLDVSDLQKSLRLGSLRPFRSVGPDSGETIRLQFQLHRSLVGLFLAGTLLNRFDLFGNVEQVLDVMTDLVSDYISLCKISGGSESITEFLKKREVEINLLVGWAVERTHRSLSKPARGFHRSREKNKSRGAIRASAFLEDLRPGIFGIPDN